MARIRRWFLTCFLFLVGMHLTRSLQATANMPKLVKVFAVLVLWYITNYYNIFRIAWNCYSPGLPALIPVTMLLQSTEMINLWSIFTQLGCTDPVVNWLQCPAVRGCVGSMYVYIYIIYIYILHIFILHFYLYIIHVYHIFIFLYPWYHRKSSTWFSHVDWFYPTTAWQGSSAARCAAWPLRSFSVSRRSDGYAAMVEMNSVYPLVN